MSQVAFSVDERPALMPLDALVAALIPLDVTFRRKGDALALKNSAMLTDELRQAVADHKGTLLVLSDLRAGLARLLEYSVRLRCEDPPKGTRAQALRYQAAQIEKLAALSVSIGGTVDGWPDPGDPFAYGDQIAGLRVDLAELKAGAYPVPLPEGCVLVPQANFNPFEHGRNYAGKVIGG